MALGTTDTINTKFGGGGLPDPSKFVKMDDDLSTRTPGDNLDIDKWTIVDTSAGGSADQKYRNSNEWGDGAEDNIECNGTCTGNAGSYDSSATTKNIPVGANMTAKIRGECSSTGGSSNGGFSVVIGGQTLFNFSISNSATLTLFSVVNVFYKGGGKYDIYVDKKKIGVTSGSIYIKIRANGNSSTSNTATSTIMMSQVFYK